MLFSGCTSRESKQFMGVPVGGTLWEFAAAIADKGDGTFVPECVQPMTCEKGYIDGWLLLDEDRRATVVCDMQDGKVVDAVIIEEGKE